MGGKINKMEAINKFVTAKKSFLVKVHLIFNYLN